MPGLPRPVTRALAIAAAGLAVLVGLLWVRAVAESRSSVSRAELAGRDDQPELARQAYLSALRWNAPINPYASEALERLLRIARQAEREGKQRRALRVYREIRGALVASAGLWQPESALLAEVDDQIAALTVHVAPHAAQAAGPVAVRRALDEARPPVAARVLALAGFVVWVTAAFVLAAAGFSRQGAARMPIALPAGLVVLLGFGCFCLGLLLA